MHSLISSDNQGTEPEPENAEAYRKKFKEESIQVPIEKLLPALNNILSRRPDESTLTKIFHELGCDFATINRQGSVLVPREFTTFLDQNSFQVRPPIREVWRTVSGDLIHLLSHVSYDAISRLSTAQK
jgi:hypothetical protein